jgi:hypothetical protein
MHSDFPNALYNVTIRNRNCQFKCLKTLGCAYETWPYHYWIIRRFSQLLTFKRYFKKVLRYTTYSFCVLYFIIIIIIFFIISVMQLGHLLTRYGLTCPVVSSKVWHVSFCHSRSSVSLPWVIYYEAFSLHIVSSLSCIPVICPKLELFLYFWIHNHLIFITPCLMSRKTASRRRIINKVQRIWNGPWDNLKYYPDFCLEELGKLTTTCFRKAD